MTDIPLHPMIIHFTIALFLTSVLLDFAALLLRKPRLHEAAWYNLILSGVAAVFSVFSGLSAKTDFADIPQAARSLDIHQTLAFLISAGILGLIFWRLSARGNIPGKYKSVYLSISFLVAVLLIAGAYYGGELVYRYRANDKTSFPRQQNIPPEKPSFY